MPDGVSRLLYTFLAASLLAVEGKLLSFAARVHATARWANNKAKGAD